MPCQIQYRETILPAKRLSASNDGTHFNASIIDYKGQRLLAYRAGRGGSQIHVCPLSERLEPGISVRLRLDHKWATHGREDPRLFIYQGRLHVGYIGVSGTNGPTHCLYARLTDDLKVEQIFYPEFGARAAWEKNWTWFEWSGELFAVYSISPHVVLHVVNDRAEEFARQEWQPRWSGGLLRGGASPVLVGDEHWHWFHGKVDKGKPLPTGRAERATYSIGVYAFEAQPPFRPTRYTPAPILWADPRTRPAGFWCDCVFPCGAVLDGEKWVVSAGVHDTHVALYEFDARTVEKALVKL